MTWGDCLLPVDDEVFIYYGGYARGHKVERFKERQIGFARMKRDRFVARHAGADPGVLRTQPVRLDGSTMTINAAVKGELRVALLGSDGRPLPGFTTSDAQPVSGDSLAHSVRWGATLNGLRGKPVQIEFHLRDASLYSFELGA
jgi:hypothetical protein